MTSLTRVRFAFGLAAPLLSQLALTSAYAQAASTPPPAEENILTEIVVTSARMREESVQESPVAVTVMTDRDMEMFHASDITDVSGVTPNLQVTETGWSGATAQVFMRGFGVTTGQPSTDPAVAIYVDGIYQPMVTGSLLDTFDLERFEALRGPQGTLLGKNSTAGALSVRTARPEKELGGQLKVDMARYNRTEVRGRVDVPIVQDVLTSKFSAMSIKGGDWVENIAFPGQDLGGKDIQTYRAGLLFTPNDKLDWYVTADYTIDHSSQVGGRNVTFPFAGGPETHTVPGLATSSCALYLLCDPSRNPYGTTRANNTDGNDSSFYGAMSELNYNFGPASLTSVSGYRRMNHIVNEDVDTEAVTMFSALKDRIRSKVISQELRLSSVADAGWDFGGRLDWVVGLYYFNVEFDQDYHFIALDTPVIIPPGIPATGGIPITQLQNGETTSSAAFAHLIYNLTDRWSISAGGRQTHDKKDHSFRTSLFPPDAPFVDESGSWNNFSYDLGTQFKLNDMQMVYLRYATGYRGGGFVDNPDFPEDATEYDPEKVKYWEVGLKADWFDRRLRTNILVFHGDYTDLQRSSTISADNPQGFKQVIDNAADATSKGVELELTAVPIPQLTLRQNVGYLKNKYDQYEANIGFGLQDLSKTDFQQSPKWTSFTAATYDYTLPGVGTDAHVNLAYSWHSKQLVYSVPSPLSYQRKLGLLDASFDFDLDHDSRMQLSIWGRNLTNERYQAFSSIITVAYLRVDGLPRTYGASLAFKF